MMGIAFDTFLPTYEPPCVRAVAADHVASTVSYMTGGGFTDGVVGEITDPESEETISEAFNKTLRYHFGFDEETAGDLCLLLESMVSFCSGVSYNRELKAAWAYFRILGAFCYGDGGVSGLEWGMVAGNVGGVYSGSFLDNGNHASADEERFFVESLGLTRRQYLRVRYMVRLQHELCDESANNAGDWFDDPVYHDTIVDAYRAAISQDVGDEELRTIWGGLSRAMCVMPDFAHMCITASAMLAGELGYCGAADAAIGLLYGGVVTELGTTSRTREALAGWLGDAAVGSGGTSFGWDDYWADIDVLGIASLLGSSGYAVARSVKSHYAPATGDGGPLYMERRPYFEQSVGVGTAARCIAAALSVTGSTPDEVVESLQGRDGYADTARFLLVLGDDPGTEAPYHAGSNELS